jgi:uncharacterized membrane protein
MEGVESITQLDDTRLHWVAEIAGTREEWDAEITEQTPDQRIAWRSTTGATNNGAVTFRPIDDQHSMVSLELEYEPTGLVETVGDKVGLVGKRVEGDLQRFKEFIESRPRETGAWRGEIHGARVEENPAR